MSVNTKNSPVPAPTIVMTMNIFYKENRAFSSWIKKFLVIMSDKYLLIYKSDTDCKKKKSPSEAYPCSKIEICDVENSSKPLTFLIAAGLPKNNEKKRFLISPVLGEVSASQIKDLKKKVVEAGGSEVEAVFKPAWSFLPSSLAPEVPISNNHRSRLEHIEVQNWNKDDVQEWLGYVQGPDGESLKTSFGELFLKNDIKSGDVLLELNDSFLKEMGITSLGVRIKILKEIKKLKEKKIYDLNEFYVMEKISRMNPKWLSSITNIEERVHNLCDVESIKETYLNIDKSAFADLIPETQTEPQKIEKIEKNEKNDENDEIIIAEDSAEFSEDLNVDEFVKKQIKTKIGIEQMYKDSLNLNEEGTEILDFEKVPKNFILQKSTENYDEKRKKIPIKLIITEIMHSNQAKTIRSLLSPLIGRIPTLNTKFGLFHTAIIVGPWYLEWTDSSLCIPKKISSSMAILAMDIDTLTVEVSSLPLIADKLAQLIVDWNVNYTYKNFSPGKTEDMKILAREANCQDFCLAVLNKLGIKPNFSGAMQRYLDEMRQNGCCEMIFRPKKQFRERTGLEKKAYRFETHQELDEFVLNLKKKDLSLAISFPSEMSLLKAFDRGFWVRNFKNPDVEKFQPISVLDPDTNCLKCGCPYRDPRETMTMYSGG